MQQKVGATQDTSLEDDLSEQRKNILNKFVKSFSSLFIPKQKTTLKESLEEILDEREDKKSPNQVDDTSILRNVLEFNELYVEDVMIPRADIFAIEESIDFEALKKQLLDKIYTRIPIYKDDLDEIKGFIHIKDIAKMIFNEDNYDISKITRKCLFVPSSMKISNLLIRMQQSRVHIAIVVDEYGGTEGLITLEDIMEEIVGKIEDEHEYDDKPEPKIKKMGNGQYEMSSRFKIEEIKEKIGVDLPEDDSEYDTMGGLLFDIAGRIPVEGEVIEINDKLEAEIKEADARTIKKLILRKKK